MAQVRVPDVDKIVQHMFEYLVENKLPEYQRMASERFTAEVVKKQLEGERTGRLYPRDPSVWYTNINSGTPLYRASRPDEIPAERTGKFMRSWQKSREPVVRISDKKASTLISSRTRYKVYSKGPLGGAQGKAWNLGLILLRGHGATYNKRGKRLGGPAAGRTRYPYDITNRGKARVVAYTSRFRWGLSAPLKQTEASYASGSNQFAKYVER